MDDHLNKAIAEFVTTRVNHHGENEPENISKAAAKLCGYAGRLQETLTHEQGFLFMDCEDAYAEVDGETMRYYYKAGFGDAIGFLMGWFDQR